MNYEYVEVHAMWRLAVVCYTADKSSYNIYESIWVPLTLTTHMRTVAESLDATVFPVIGNIHFKSMEDITMFRLRTGV